MKAITIQQPFATLIAEGFKKYEFRTWKTSYRGDILIHAGKRVDRPTMNQFLQLGLEYPRGAIIAKARLTDCIEVTDEFREILKEKNLLVYSGVLNDSTWKGYAFILEDVEKIKPIETKGKLSFWEFDYSE